MIAVVCAVAVVLAVTEVGAVGVGIFVDVRLPLVTGLCVDDAIVVSIPPGRKQTLCVCISVFAQCMK